MSLLQNASLVLTPNAYKTSKLYSIIPSNGNGDFTFSRAGSATETVSSGLIEDVPYNLFQYSEEFSNGYWLKTSGTLTPNVTTAPDGTLTADLFTKTGAINTTSNISRAVSTTFYLGITTVSIYVKKNVGDIVGLRLVSGTQFEYNFSTGIFSNIAGTLLAYGAEDVGNGWIRLYLTANATSAISPFMLNMFSAATGDSVYVWGAQLNKGYLQNYIKTTDRTNIPRLDYTLGSCPTIEIEPSRTNLITFSEDLTQSSVYTLSDVTISTNQIVAPDGNTTADKVIPNNIVASHRIRLNNYGYNAAGATVTISVFAKKGELTKFRLGVSAGSAIGALFDLDNGTFTNISTGIGRITAYPNGWYRCSVTGIVGTVCDTLLTDNSGNANFAGNGTDGLYLWGWQFEQWPGAGLTTTSVFYTTSYIPTYGASVTRVNEGIALSNLVVNNIVSATGGTWFIHLVDNIPITRESATPTDRGLFIGDTTLGSSHSILIRRVMPGTLLRASVAKSISGSTTGNIYTTSANEVKLVIRYNIGVAGSFDVFENGVKVVTASAFTGNVPLTYVGTKTSPSVSESPFANIKSMALFNTQLSDAECIALTTL